ncbi:MAG: extracellular solute-binding protein [Clostridiales bacterium]|jgi:ABC-type glycerol-3-phosphate transport system substrate-binding protein|nr:extracellular solute-binding protein [Clostridiales bacterium]
MIERLKKNIVPIVIGSAVVLAVVLLFILGSRVTDYSEKYANLNLSSEASGRSDTYAKYAAKYSGIPSGAEDIFIDIFSYTASDGAEVLNNFEGEEKVLLTSDRGFVEYSVSVPSEGMYNIYLEYFPVESRGVDIERAVVINGEVPFFGAETVRFERIWGDGGEVREDNQGNELRPTQVEKPRWESSYVKDRMGYFTEPYAFYLKPGENVIRINGVNEPLALRELTLTPVAKYQPYSEYAASVDTAKFQNTDTGFVQKVQGEAATNRSSASLYAIYDRSSGATEPSSVSTVKLNMIGGQSWRVAGQWIEWDFEVPEDGMYKLSFKARQNYNRGFVSNRSVAIDGEILCEELLAVPFKYDTNWDLVTLCDKAGEEMYFPLTKGKHTVRMTAVLGELGNMLNTMSESVFRLNEIYRKILVLTGPTPDTYRDYRVELVYPNEVAAMATESQALYKLVDDLTRYAGERSPQTATALTLAKQLETFNEKPEKIPPQMAAGVQNSFKSNISALADGVLALSDSQLDIDYMVVSAKDAEMPRFTENFVTGFVHEMGSFLASFFTDYNKLGDTYTDGGDVEVWITTGRDQSTIIKSMIDDMFTPETNTRVELKLVGADAIMPAVVAGTGPDSVLTVGSAEPVNYAVRGASYDLSGFEGFNDVISWFAPSAVEPLKYDGGVYGLPETQGFHVMFYRTDVLEELGIEAPETWDDLISILLAIQKNNMNVGLPSVVNGGMAGTANAGDIANFLAHLYQRGGSLYNEDHSRTTIDEEAAIEAFSTYTKFFTHYQTPMNYDFVNRFRSGEMPIGFTDFSMFNTLEVFAPEIRGLWEFGLLPGTVQEDGTVNHSAASWGMATMMFPNADDKEATWNFMKWWVSSDTQVRFGREMESLMGSAARYNTANIDAFSRLNWSASQMDVLNAQRGWTVGTPEVPGGYYVNRHIINAARRVLYSREDTRETLLDYSREINEELERKRKEFGLE